MQVKNIISFFFLFQSIFSAPRRNGYRVKAVETEIETHRRFEPIENLIRRATKTKQQKGKLRVDEVIVVEGLVRRSTKLKHQKGKLNFDTVVVVG